jgi:hypothetical protein
MSTPRPKDEEEETVPIIPPKSLEARVNRAMRSGWFWLLAILVAVIAGIALGRASWPA